MSIAVVHLASGSLGVPPLEIFVRSYNACDPGLEHRLIVVFNRFGPDPDAAEGHREVLQGTPHEELWPDRPLEDLAAYVMAVDRVDAERFCFLNSTSEVLVDGWLAKLDAHARRPEIGMAGATATFESHVTGALHAGMLGRGMLRDLATRARRLVSSLLTWRTFPRFPNPHLRTNGFMIDAALMCDLSIPVVRNKRAAHALESGRHSLTRRVLASGHQVVVVGRDERAYPPERWPESGTFRVSDQENLLIADGRTREYADADPERRCELARLAWGQGR